MMDMFRKVFCFLGILGFVHVSWGQTQVDIPLFMDDDSSTPPQVIQAKPVKAPQSEPVAKADHPNLGVKAEPMKKVTLLPPPAPRIDISLEPNPPEVSVEQPKQPINKRLESIDIQLLSGGDTSYNQALPARTLTDVRGFELNGFYLGMTLDDILQVAKENGYKVTSSKKDISKFRTGYYESLCRSQKIYFPAEIRKCIRQLSQQNDTTYVSKLKLVRPSSREIIEFDLSSPATNNRVWKIYYQNKGDNSLSFTRANVQKKLDRKEAFFNAIYNKFGYPENGEKLIWGSEGDAYMQVGMYGSNYDAFIILTDVELSDEDYFEAKDWLDDNKPFEHFGFED